MDLDGVRVLLIEDEADTREILATALRHHGATILEASSTPAALEVLDTAIAADARPDVIVSDIGLPEEDGYQLMAQLSGRSAADGGQIPVIAVTAYGRPQDKRQALAAGFRMHVTKPVTPDLLAAAVLSVVPLGGARRR
jgi:CheY-like chemotaxis protein